MVDKQQETKFAASKERTRAAHAMVKKSIEKGKTHENVIAKLVGDIAGYKAAARKAESERDELGLKLTDLSSRLVETLDALDASNWALLDAKSSIAVELSVASKASENKNPTKTKSDDDESNQRITGLISALVDGKRRAESAEHKLAELQAIHAETVEEMESLRSSVEAANAELEASKSETVAAREALA